MTFKEAIAAVLIGGGLVLLGVEITQEAPWQAGIAAGILMILIGAVLVSPDAEQE